MGLSVSRRVTSTFTVSRRVTSTFTVSHAAGTVISNAILREDNSALLTEAGDLILF